MSRTGLDNTRTDPVSVRTERRCTRTEHKNVRTNPRAACTRLYFLGTGVVWMRVYGAVTGPLSSTDCTDVTDFSEVE